VPEQCGLDAQLSWDHLNESISLARRLRVLSDGGRKSPDAETDEQRGEQRQQKNRSPEEDIRNRMHLFHPESQSTSVAQSAKRPRQFERAPRKRCANGGLRAAVCDAVPRLAFTGSLRRDHANERNLDDAWGTLWSGSMKLNGLCSLATEE